MSPPSSSKKGTKGKGKTKTRKGKKVEEADTPVTNAIPFEQIFYDPATQAAALDEFQEAMKKCVGNVEDDRTGTGGSVGVDLRSGSSSKASGKVKEGKKKGKKKTEVGSSKAEDGSQDEPIGKVYVHDLLQRYDANRLNSRPKNGNRQRLLSDSDISLDEDILEEDYREAMEGVGSNFLKYSVPQYELKEKLCQMHYQAIENLSMAEIISRLDEVLPELDQIRCEQLTCERHDIFKGLGLSKQSLREMTVVQPFSSSQDYRVMTLIQEKLFGNQDLTENNGEILHYISNVLLQEALVRIFARVNKIDIQLAEKELRFKAGYDGELSPDVIKTIPNAGGN